MGLCLKEHSPPFVEAQGVGTLERRAFLGQGTTRGGCFVSLGPEVTTGSMGVTWDMASVLVTVEGLNRVGT